MTMSHDFCLDFPPLPDENGKYGQLSGREAYQRGYLPAKVFLNDVEIDDCVLFDDIQGWADVYDRENGQIVVNEKGDGPRVRRLFGEIRYEPNIEDRDL